MNEMIFDLIMGLNNLVGIFIAIRFYKGVFKKKEISKQKQYTLMIVIFFVFTILNIINQAIDIGIFVAFILYFIISLLMYEGKVHIKAVGAIFIVIFSMITELLTALSFLPLFSVSMDKIRGSLVLLFLGGMISKILLLLIFEIITRVISRKASLVSTGSWLLIITIPAVSLYLSVASVYQDVMVNEFSLRIIMISFFILYINLIAFYLFDRIVVQIYENNKRKFHEEQLLMEREQYQNILSGYEQVKKIRHDMNNHLIILENYIENGKYTDAGKYLNQLQGELKKSVKEIISGNIVVDALINHRKKDKVDSPILLTTDIFIPSKLQGIDDMDLCIILGNGLDNAYEACQRIVDPTSPIAIQLTMKYNENQLFLQLKNPYNPLAIRRKSSEFMTSKEDLKMHGMGIGNIKAIVEKYNGIFKAEGKEDLFELHIIIPDQKPLAIG